MEQYLLRRLDSLAERKMYYLHIGDRDKYMYAGGGLSEVAFTLSNLNSDKYANGVDLITEYERKHLR